MTLSPSDEVEIATTRELARRHPQLASPANRYAAAIRSRALASQHADAFRKALNHAAYKLLTDEQIRSLLVWKREAYRARNK